MHLTPSAQVMLSVRAGEKMINIIFTLSVLILVSSILHAQNQVEAYIDDPDGFTNIREKPDIKSEVIGKVLEGELFICYPDSSSNWWPVISGKKLKGYVHKSRIKSLLDLTKEIIEFFRVFSNISPNNAEYGEIYNEDMFEYARKFPLAFIDAFSKSNENIQKYILEELETPIHDLIDIRLIYKRIKDSNGNSEAKELILASIRIAAEKSGMQLK